MNYDNFRNNPAYSAAPTPQKMMDDNFAASLQLLSTPFNDMSSARSLSTSFNFKERCQSVEGGREEEEDTRLLCKPQLSGDEENEWESLAVLSDDAAAHPATLKNEPNKTTPSNGCCEDAEDEVGRVMPLECADWGLKKDAGSIDDGDDMEASGTPYYRCLRHIDFSVH